MGRRGVWGLGVALALALAPALAVRAPAWQWPVPEPIVTRSFGQDAGGYLLRGMEFGGGAQPVFPVDSGVVVVSQPGEGDVPTGLGAYVVVEHGQGFRSVYAHLDAQDLPRVGAEVDVDTPIATVGESGMVEGRTLRLYIIDLESGDYVNPMLLLPDLPDGSRPRFETVYARDAESLYNLQQSRSIPPGTYEVFVAVTDRLGRGVGADLAPYAIRVFVAGQETFSITMDRIVVDATQSRIEPGGLGAEELYGGEGLFRLGEAGFGSGRTEVEIVVLDFAGNETSWDMDVTGEVHEDVQ